MKPEHFIGYTCAKACDTTTQNGENPDKDLNFNKENLGLCGFLKK